MGDCQGGETKFSPLGPARSPIPGRSQKIDSRFNILNALASLFPRAFSGRVPALGSSFKIQSFLTLRIFSSDVQYPFVLDPKDILHILVWYVLRLGNDFHFWRTL